MRAYLDIQSSQGKQRLFLELFPERAPLACKNFVGLCAASDGYKNSEIHRLVAPEFIVQGGDVGRSVFEDGEFAIESPGWCDLSEGGYLCMASSPQGKNLCQWFITLEGYPHLSASNTVFGRLLEPEALEYLKTLGNVPVDDNYKPLESVKVVKCGEMRWEEDEAETKAETKEVVEEEEREDRWSSRERDRDRDSRIPSRRHGRPRSPGRSRRRRRHREERSRSPRSDRNGYGVRQRHNEDRYRDNSESTRRLRRWENRHQRRPRSRSPSEKISEQRMREDIARHIVAGNNEPSSRKPREVPIVPRDGVVRKGRGFQQHSADPSHHDPRSGRLSRPA
ncbi:Peptidyl-prolyl cis-trans isomerase ppi1 [Yarrowia sp. C11]|nr:Peptidyl-prolyl cis-trans isomerase ppi1 [Yarrowia sp. C11]